jgi:hypothetical protein
VEEDGIGEFVMWLLMSSSSGLRPPSPSEEEKVFIGAEITHKVADFLTVQELRVLFCCCMPPSPPLEERVRRFE